MGTNMAILIAHRACGANHEKTPASKAKGNETAAKASSVLLVASPTTMNNAIPPRPMKKAKIENATPFPIPDLMCIRSILSTRFYMERLAAGTKTTPLFRNQPKLGKLPACTPFGPGRNGLAAGTGENAPTPITCDVAPPGSGALSRCSPRTSRSIP